MGNIQLVQEVRGVMTRFEPLTAEALECAAQGEIHFPELAALLKRYGLSMEFVVHDPTRHYLSTFYADYARGVYLELYLTGQYLRESLPALLRNLPQDGGAVPELTTQNWASYYIRCVPVPMLIYDFQRRYRDIPGEQVFSVWYKAIHKRIDYANNMWLPEVLDYVFSLAPATELPSADADGQITLYRGMGTLSQPPEQAISWSSHPVSALWFAIHFGRGTHIVVAHVRPDQIVHYSSGYYDENEVLVRPGTVSDCRYEDMIPAQEHTVPKLLMPALQDFLQYGRTAQQLGYPMERTPFQVHGLLHILRVLLLSLIYYYNSGDALTAADKHILIYFSLLHDIGRISEDQDDGHGDASVQLIRARGIRLKGISLSRKDFQIAGLLIRFHCRDDQVGLDAIQSQSNLSRREKERAKHLYQICKDMDGLDRVRFNGLDYRMLRTEYGRKLPLVAGCLLEERLLDALQSDLYGKEDSNEY